jgi:glyoxylase-like metal-dependent hydrolase (beta-lactamase superfamily II)
MRKTELSQGVIQYIFEPVEGKHYGNNVIVVISDDKAIMIDTGYVSQTEEVIKDLEEAGIAIDSVILSHFHEGHIQGLIKLSGVRVYGSSYYQETLKQWLPIEEQSCYIPTDSIEKSHKIIFGDHIIELLHNPGHTLCTLLIKIDERFLYIADELIYSPKGEPILPYVTKNDIINHYISVHGLTKYNQYIIIPGHGETIRDSGQIIRDIKNVCHYLCEILSHDEEITVDQATKNCGCDFLHKEWHEKVYKA